MISYQSTKKSLIFVKNKAKFKNIFLMCYTIFLINMTYCDDLVEWLRFAYRIFFIYYNHYRITLLLRRRIYEFSALNSTIKKGVIFDSKLIPFLNAHSLEKRL